MGQCVSMAPSGSLPRCRICGFEATVPWSQLEHHERAQWIWHGKGMACRKCVVARRLERIQHAKARAEDAKAKEELYPKASLGVVPLRRVRSGQAWEGTLSFRASWRPSSSLRRLMSAIEKAQQAEPGTHVGVQRKPTGFVPPDADTAVNPTSCTHPQGQLQAEAARALSGPAGLEEQRPQVPSEELLLLAGRAQLAALEAAEGIQRVEELSVKPSSLESTERCLGLDAAQPSCCRLAKGDQHLAAATGDATEAPEAERAEWEQELARAPPAEQLKPQAPACEASSLTDSGWHGDSAFFGEEEPCQWVCSRA